MRKSNIAIIGSQMDLGAFRKGVDMGPLAIRHAGLASRIRDVGYQVTDYGDVVPLITEEEGNPKLRYQREINDSNFRLYNKVLECHRNDKMPIILGGDHSIAIGSISATLSYYKRIGIIWVDAHADFNDEKITPSGNIHGMPLSAVCWILRSGEAACPAVAEPPVRTDGATRLLSITPVHRGECHRPHALNGLSLDLLHGC